MPSKTLALIHDYGGRGGGRLQPPERLRSQRRHDTRAPKTTTLFVLAVVVLVISGALVSGYYPALKPVLGPDGTAVLARDMAKYYRVNAPAFALLGCSGLLFIWWLIRVSKYLYVCFVQKRAS